MRPPLLSRPWLYLLLKSFYEEKWKVQNEAVLTCAKFFLETSSAGRYLFVLFQLYSEKSKKNIEFPPWKLPLNSL